MNTKLRWNSFKEPRPYICIMGFVHDSKGNFVTLHRSDKVRSAKNAWSLVTGLHECGKTVYEQLNEECKEELNIELTGNLTKITFFDVIIPEDKWHWLVVMVACKVKTFKTLKNMEPEKHDKIEIMNIDTLWQQALKRQWTPRLDEVILNHYHEIKRIILINRKTKKR